VRQHKRCSVVVDEVTAVDPSRVGPRRRLRNKVLVADADFAEEAMCLISDSGGKDQRLRAAKDAVAEAQRPQAVDQDGVAVPILELAAKCACLKVVGVDGAVAKVTNLPALRDSRSRQSRQQRPTQALEKIWSRHPHGSPGRRPVGLR
jgi:hypothetical protein